MDTIQATGFIAVDRPLLGQMAIATVLVGSAAALSSAGIAVPVSQVGFGSGWGDRVPVAPQVAQPLPLATPSASLRTSIVIPPLPVLELSREMEVPTVASAPRSAIAPDSLARISPARIELGSAPRLRLASISGNVSKPVLAEPLVVPPTTAIPALAVPPTSVVEPGAAPLSLAVSAVPLPVPAVTVGAPSAPPVSLAVPAAAVVPEAVPSAAPPFRLVNPPELRGFDLAKLSNARKAVPGFARPATMSALTGKVEGLGKKDSVVGDAVYHQVSVVVAGLDGKTVDVRIGADMKPSIKVGDLLALVSDRMDPDSAARFAAAGSAGDYVNLATLRAAGFDVSYNAGTDTISISASQ